MAGPKAPQMQVGHRPAVAINRLANFVGQSAVRNSIEQDGTGVANESIGPTGDYAGPDNTSQGIHPQPPEGPREQESDDYQDRHGRIRHHVDNRRPHIVVTPSRSVSVIMFLEHGRVGIWANLDHGAESVRLGNLSDLLQELSARAESKFLF